MHIPGQGFGRELMKMDRLARPILERGNLKKEQLEIITIDLPIPWDIACTPSLPCVARCRWHNHHLGLLTIFFLFSVTRTGIGTWCGTGKHALGHCMLLCACCQTQPTSCTLFSNLMVLKTITKTHTILYAAHSDCHATPQDHDFSTASLKKEVCKQP